MEIVYLLSSALRRGPVNQALNILIGLNKLPNIHAVLVTFAPEKEGDSWIERFKDNNIEVVQFNQPLWKSWRCVSLLKHYIKEHHIDVVHSAGFRADFINMFMSGHAKTVTTQRCLPNEIVEKFPKQVRKPFEKLHVGIIKKMDRIVACSKSIQSAYVAECGTRVDAVQNGVNTDYFVPVSLEKKLELRKKLNIPAYKIVYLVLGVLVPRKNNKLIIDAFHKIENDNIELLIVGAGTEEKMLKERAGNDKRITFTGATGFPLQYLQASDILISSSLAEGLPNTVLEALACGLPCVLSDIDPHKEIFESEIVGSLFDRNSEKELVVKIEGSFQWNLNDMSKEARKLTEKHFGLSILANNYLDSYSSIKK